MAFKRTNFLPKRNFQMRFLIRVFGALAAVVLLLSVAFYVFNYVGIRSAKAEMVRFTQNVLAKSDAEDANDVKVEKNISAFGLANQAKQLQTKFEGVLKGMETNMFYAFVVSLIISLILVGTFFLVLSHRIAGPIYRFEKTVASIEQGDLTVKIFLRDHDELRDLGNHINQMTSSLNQKVHLLQQTIIQLQLDLEKTSVDAEARRLLLERVGTLEALLKQFKIAYH